MERIIKQLKLYMAENDLTVVEIAKLVNRHPQTIYKFLKGEITPTFQTLYQIKKLLKGKPEIEIRP